VLPAPAPGLVQVNSHLDPIDWHGTRRGRGPAELACELAALLAARRLGCTDPAEPTGVLTHHLLEDRASEAFMADLLRQVAAHPAAAWVSAGEAFAA
jgi:hypothetical protein